MLDEYRIVEVKDWHQIPKSKLQYDSKLFCHKSINTCDSTNLGLYLNERDEYCVCGYVGVCVLKDKNDDYYVGPDGKKVILKVLPRFCVSPWEMLSEIMNDNEYEKYVDASENVGQKFYEIFDDEKPIKLDIEYQGGEVLLALSFIRLCFKICTSNINRKMDHVQENLNGKIKGRVDFPNHIKKNVVIGREDRIYCKYPKFTEDTLENQILKQALQFSERILRLNGCLEVKGLAKIKEMLVYSKRRLKNVSDRIIKKSDFSIVDIKGFNVAYAPVIEIAEMIITHSAMSISAKGEKTGFVVPYAIRMETVFEYYMRSIIKKEFQKDGNEAWRIDEYRDVTDKNSLLRTTLNENNYLMNTYIPDIAVQFYNDEKMQWEYVGVFDVKYQKSKNSNSEAVRHNSHQLLFYALLLNVSKCGFIFPQEEGQHYEKTEDYLVIQEGNLEKSNRVYTEFHFGYERRNTHNEMNRMIEYVKRMY